MAPKALTDCPENLREAIDWLIQVKQGGGIATLCQALGELLDNVVQDAGKSLPSLPESDEPSAGDVVGQLKEFRSSFPKDSENTNQNILHNICSALETFVGYKPPGTYDGSGIVYGSASRLCDAVLSFLSRVISDVGDNQPYVVGGALLSGLVSDLKNARWTGHHGYKAVVPKVASGLGEYNRKVKASNDKVKRPIDEMIAYVKEVGGELTPKISELNETNPSDPDVKAAEELAKECVGRGKDFGKAFNVKNYKHYMKDAFDDLNASLREKIHNARNSVGRETAMLSRWSKKQRDNYNAMIKLIKQAFQKLKDMINSKIEKEVTDLVESLKGLVKNILAKLENISKTLGKIISDLGKWMKEAEEIINAALGLVQNIYDELDDPGKSKDKLDTAIKTVEKKLEQNVKDLETWKTEADSVVQHAISNSTQVHTALDKGSATPGSIGQNITKITDANSAISEANTQLGQRVGDLGAWKDAVDKVLEGVILHSEDVHGKLDYELQDPIAGTKIGQGVWKINAAKGAVSRVDGELKERVKELGQWNSAARTVLSTAVQKAGEVHRKLNPDGSDTIGKKVTAITEAKNDLDGANERLREQVGKLDGWITDAEEIRKKAQKKAQEAFDKLDYKKELADNIKKIEKANKAINGIHKNLQGVEKSLGTWKSKAYDVLEGVIGKAEEVYNKLESEIGAEITNIEQRNKAIQGANTELGTEVQHLGKWKTAAEKVIEKADKKCDAILEKVDTKDGTSKGEIFLKAKKLSDDGKSLFKAAEQAKSLVESRVKEALGQVKEMDSKLKEDLYNIKTQLIQGIKNVVEQKIRDLPDKVRDDLQQLRNDIEKLNQNGGDSLVQDQLSQLSHHKEKYLDQVVSLIQIQTNKNLESNFNAHIQVKLSNAVRNVDNAIRDLGQHFKEGGMVGKQNIKEIFDHIHEKVGEIKGKAGGNNWHNSGGSGLEGIKSKVDFYFQEFGGGNDGNKFKYERVTGWLDDILQHNGVVKKLLGWERKGAQALDKELHDSGLGGFIKEPINPKIDDAVKVFSGVNAVGIKDKITKVKDACTKFAEALDDELKKKPGTGGSVNELVKNVKQALTSHIGDNQYSRKQALVKVLGTAKCSCKCQPHCNGSKKDCTKCERPECILSQAAESILCALTSTVRQVGKELKSVLLEPPSANIAEMLDKITPTVDNLDKALKGATERQSKKPPGPSKDEGPAQAVDNRLQDVRNFVNGSKNDSENMASKFRNEVTQQLKNAVEGLPGKVTEFDEKAKEQIKAAAKTAIDKAVNVISDSNSVTEEDVKTKMDSFHAAHSNTTTQLPTELKKEIDQHIGDDDGPSAGGGAGKIKNFAASKFGSYQNHVNAEELENVLRNPDNLTGIKQAGTLPQVIGDIKTVGLAELNKHIGQNAGAAQITDTTFTGPFENIKKELEAIQELVDENGKPAGSEDGIQNLLEKLKKGLNTDKLDGSDESLNTIENAINTLQTGTFEEQPKQIGQAISTIKLELTKLRKELKNYAKPENAVINALQDLQTNGLAIGDWTFEGKWKNTDNLTAIQYRFKNQNNILPKQTEIITKAITAIELEHLKVGLKIKGIMSDDNVLEHLEKLQKQIGEKVAENGNLKQIRNVISGLQSREFTDKLRDIATAKEGIVQELGNLRTMLQGTQGQKDDVIHALKDLMNTGLSGQDKWAVKGVDKKGLLKIHGDLNTQQKTLNTQPDNIQNGVTEITGELTRLQGELDSKVTDMLTALRADGLNTTDPWIIDTYTARGMNKIRSEIKGLKDLEFTDNPKQITQRIQDIKRELDEQRNKLEREVTARLRDLQSKGLADGEWNLGSQKISGLTKITNGISDIKAENVEDVKHKLSILRGVIKYTARDIRGSLKQLKDNMLGNRLRKIRDDLQQLHITLVKGAIKDCKAFIDRDADVFKQRCIDELTHYVNQELKAAEEELLQEERRQYVSTIKEMLSAFAAKVETELEQLPGAINRDLYTGYKGLIKYLHGPLSSDLTGHEKGIPKIASAFQEVYEQLQTYLLGEIRREADQQNRKKNPSLPPSEELYSAKLNEVYAALSNLLTHLRDSHGFDHRLRGLLKQLTKSLAGMRPESFQQLSTPTLDTVARGLGAFAGEFTNVYVSAYSGQTFTAELVKTQSADQSAGQASDQNIKLTPYGAKCAKVFLSTVPILCELIDVNVTCMLPQWAKRPIFQNGQENPLASFFAERGYNVPSSAEKQDGELRCGLTGMALGTLLTKDNTLFTYLGKRDGPLRELCKYLKYYYRVFHFIRRPRTKRACNVYEMLCWLTGIKYNCVYDKLRKCIKMCHEEQTENSLYPTALTADALVSAVDSLTADSPTLLTRVLGYGNAFTTYAVDFYNNSLQLYYPQDGEDCLHMMLHYLCLLLSVLRYLLSQCSLAAHHGGWAECKYGRGVPPYTWQCDPPLSALPNPHPECSDKSPLMSYLNDCLPGHLPHQLTSVGCISSLLSLEPRPPATLAEHFAFALSLVNDWHDGKVVPKNSLQQALEASATDLSLRLCKQPHQLTAALTAAYGSDSAKHGGCKHPHLMHLAASDFCTRHQASPFLSTLCRGMYDSLAHRHSDLYLSWAIYLPWTFYEMLLCLYTAFKEISCRDWGCGDCLHEGPCDEGSHGVRTPQSPASGCRCPSIVQCRGAMPTLYSYGLTFGDASALISQNENCSTLAKQLSQVLHSDHFTELFHEIDKLLYRIRAPFLFCVAALWLIATLYIIIVLLYRMDILRIRSQLLTTRASHLVDVKALLSTGGRMLSLYQDVDYFDDDILTK
ncbi:Extracellular matrix-binding ebh, putative [Babesia ovata]|uniref:Extracellular matrix-binding ebh, putative n=1 Tax=Babesia ovata TaxID=189622 RepID=A0A2H6K6V7_9APIC|nr:Extracellular matrix-binding ebh, putative [Babesia ovata]GBE58721.1 Extracellular matrix-binding ebh, putative [Babesia ovata]